MKSIRVCRACSQITASNGATLRTTRRILRRAFHASSSRSVVKAFPLADIGEGTRECQIIQWFVKPGTRVEQFDKLCEVQSDKAATDITSPYDGVIKKLYWDADDTAIVGKPLVDIDIDGELSPEDEDNLSKPAATAASEESMERDRRNDGPPTVRQQDPDSPSSKIKQADDSHRTLATPAVRHLSREMRIDIAEVKGTGRDGRVTKEDLHKHTASSSDTSQHKTPIMKSTSSPATSWQQPRASPGEDRVVSLTPVQSGMYKTMTRSLSIPHFLYTTTVDLSPLSAIRSRINARRDGAGEARISALPFIIKAISQSFSAYPLMNAHLDASNPDSPVLTHRSSHDFGVAVDAPSGLLVPVIRDVAGKSVAELAVDIRVLSARTAEGKLQAEDMRGASFTVSNVGSIGGGVVSPVIVPPQVGIVGMGRSRIVPAFEGDKVVRREELVMSWSADHRVVDGAYCARAAERVRELVEGVGEWGFELR